ncbi:hypothetical protein JTB14_019900 [Gonioctena quinquepunctata]|nr:hypothetical protein JTB14_019900 [Gonioctena quinquepunctata]
MTEQEDRYNQGNEFIEHGSPENTEFLESKPLKMDRGPKFGKRHEQVLCNFFLMFIAYGNRVSLSVAIVAMTDPNTSSNKDIPTYNWTDKSVILSSFFCGYIFPQVGAGWLATHYGPKWFLVGSMAVCSVAGFFVPVSAAHFGSKGVMVCRALQGLSQGFIYPSIHSLFAKWAPKNERSLLANLLYSGGPCGTVVSMILTGYISASSRGWPMVFYLFNGVGLLWCMGFSHFGCNSPSDHPSITMEEKRYIESTSNCGGSKQEMTTPWLKIFSTTPFWALLLTQCGFLWGFGTLLTETPTYMDKVMNFDLKSNSMLSSLPYVSHWLCGSFFGFISDFLINRRILSLATSRKTMNCIGFLIPALALVLLGNCASLSGFFINHVDLSPTHAGLLMGICNGFGNIFSIFAPLLVQYMVEDEEDPKQWRVIFYSSAALYVAANTIFIIFGSVDIQPWNIVANNEDRENTKLNIPPTENI